RRRSWRARSAAGSSPRAAAQRNTAASPANTAAYRDAWQRGGADFNFFRPQIVTSAYYFSLTLPPSPRIAVKLLLWGNVSRTTQLRRNLRGQADRRWKTIRRSKPC